MKKNPVPTKTFTPTDVATLCTAAQQSPRRRAHCNLHPSLDAPVQRLCIALQPDTYVRPHHHTQPNKWEMLVLLKGAVSVLIMTPDGVLLERIEMHAGGTQLVEIPAHTWHTLVCQQADTLIVEVKPGPYQPAAPEEFAAWAPAEGAEDTERFREWWRGLEAGNSMAPQKSTF